MFKSDIKGGVVPKEYIPGVTKGLEEMMVRLVFGLFGLRERESAEARERGKRERERENFFKKTPFWSFSFQT